LSEEEALKMSWCNYSPRKLQAFFLLQKYRPDLLGEDVCAGKQILGTEAALFNLCGDPFHVCGLAVTHRWLET